MSGGILPMADQREPLMNSFFEHHKDSIRWQYRCFDRILLNGIDSAIPAARAGGRLLQQLSSALSGEPADATWHCRAVSTMAERLEREAQYPDYRCP